MEGLFDGIWERIGNMLRNPPSARHDIEMAAMDAPDDTVVTLYEEEEEQEEQEQGELVIRELEEDRRNDREFVMDYATFLKSHYGREPLFLTDLYCCMVPIMVEMTNGPIRTLYRYWWLPINHPLVIRLHTWGEEHCGQVDAGFCGTCVIYADSIIVKWVEKLWRLFRDELQKELSIPTEARPSSPPQLRPPPPEPLAVASPREAPPPPVKMTMPSNKKGD